MRIIKLAILSVIFLFIAVTCVSLFIPSHVRISKAINIKTVPDSVWNKVDDIRQWEQWNPFFSDLASRKVTYLDTSGGTLNAVKVENTTVNWKEKKPGEHIAVLTNNTRKPMDCGWRCIPNPGTDSLTVQWYIDFRLHWYPWEKFASMVFESTYGTKMEMGLTRLKEILEK